MILLGLNVGIEMTITVVVAVAAVAVVVRKLEMVIGVIIIAVIECPKRYKHGKPGQRSLPYRVP